MVVKHSIIERIVKIIKGKQVASFTNHDTNLDGSCQTFPSHGSSLTGVPRGPFQVCHPSRLFRKLQNVQNSTSLFTPSAPISFFSVFVISTISTVFTTFTPSTVPGVFIHNASALTYQDGLDASFKFNSSISLSLSSSDLVISDLAPNTYSDSNVITITTSTNNPTGYVLTANAGNGNAYTNTNLINTDNNNSYFTSLAANTTVASMENANPNHWGYSYCLTTNDCTNNTNWINPNGIGYSGLPYYDSTNTTSGATLLTTDTNGVSSLKFKIGARADAGQIAGTYQNVVNFNVVSNISPLVCNPNGTTIHSVVCMQDINENNKESVLASMRKGHDYQLYDSRDEIQYSVSKLSDNNIWMTQNLRFSGSTLNSATSNISSKYTTDNPLTVEWYDLKEESAEGGKCYGTTKAPISGDGYSTACRHSPDIQDINDVSSYGGYTAEQLGTWYNYAGASAMTIIGASNTTNATYDICPAGWALPTSIQQSAITNDVLNFKPIYGGAYIRGKHWYYKDDRIFGLWWGASSYSQQYRWSLIYNNEYLSRGLFSNFEGVYRFFGFYIRCIAK